MKIRFLPRLLLLLVPVFFLFLMFSPVQADREPLFNLESVKFVLRTLPKVKNIIVTNIIPYSSNPVNVYPVVLDWDKNTNQFSPSYDWFNYDKIATVSASQDVYPFHWTLSIPEGVPSGEYYRVLGFTNSPYSLRGAYQCTANPPIIVGNPLTIQLAEPATPSAELAPLTAGLFPYFQLEEFSQSLPFPFLYPYFTVRVRNTGSVTAVPTGDIVVVDDGNLFLADLAFNREEESILPGQSRAYAVRFRSDHPFGGRIHASLRLGYLSYLGQATPRHTTLIEFFYLSPDLILVSLLAILVTAVLWRFSAQRTPTRASMYRLYPLLLLPLLITWAYVFASRSLGSILGVQQALQVSAQVREAIGFTYFFYDGNRYLHFTGTPTNLKWQFYTLHGKTVRLLATRDTYNHEDVVVGKDDACFPILVLAAPF